ncbi:hypothetical protein ACFMQL_03390 [Nonomuraea fastidiosa]|jgi:hypothetical protein|uniref:hypothetical protein n=1 Tax=Nonomuraea TaxID=83681 RepID=UPI00324C12DD
MSGERPKFELSLPQILGSALAAVTAAVAASYLGVAGTVIGAAVVSVSSTVATAIYTHYLKRTGERVKQRTQAAKEGKEREDAEEPRARRRLPWVKVAAAASVVFGVSMGGILVYQALTHRTVHEQVTGKKPAQAQQARQEPRREQRHRDTGYSPPAYVTTRTPGHAPAPTPSATPTPDGTKEQPSTKPSVRPTPKPAPSGSESGAVHPSEAPSTPSRDGGRPPGAEEPQDPAAPSSPQGQEDEPAGQDRAQPLS